MSIVLANVSHSHLPDRWVLRDVNLEIKAGETVASFGPSGSGKTTLLSILGLLQAPTEGEVALEGRLITSERSRQKQLGSGFAWVHQSANVLRHRTTLDNAALGLLAMGVTRSNADEIARLALMSVGLVHREKQAGRQLSGGEVQRVQIARAIAVQPRFLLADEPTGQLDRSTSIQVLDALWSADRGDAALVIATHDRDAIARCQRVLEIIDSRVLER